MHMTYYVCFFFFSLHILCMVAHSRTSIFQVKCIFFLFLLEPTQGQAINQIWKGVIACPIILKLIGLCPPPYYSIYINFLMQTFGCYYRVDVMYFLLHFSVFLSNYNDIHTIISRKKKSIYGQEYLVPAIKSYIWSLEQVIKNSIIRISTSNWLIILLLSSEGEVYGRQCQLGILALF